MIFNLFYQPLLVLFGIFYLPHLFKRLKQEPQKAKFFRERFGHYQLKLDHGCVVWIHAVSVGEVMAVKEFIKQLAEAFFDLEIILSTTTPTGQALAREMEGSQIHSVYFPFDFVGSVRRAFKTFRPDCIIVMETEIWPNLIREASKQNIPIGIINGRISDRASKRYQIARPLFVWLLSKLSYCLVCSPKDRERFLSLGVRETVIQVNGNMKFDLEMKKKFVHEEDLKAKWEIEDNKVFVAGSTHEGEEIILLNVFRMLRREFPGLKLILAPRHVDRAPHLTQSAKRHGFSSALISEGFQGESDILILDQMGALSQYYGIADIIFVGGSLVKHGGQNPIEPARERKPILHGPFVANFHDVYERLDESGGAFSVFDESTLYQKAVSLLSDPREFERRGRAAFEVVESLKGATKRNIDFIKPFLSEKTIRGRK